MSRIAKKPIIFPKEVKVSFSDETVTVEGPKGKLSLEIKGNIKIDIDNENNSIMVNRGDDNKQTKAFHGLYYRLLTNNIIGVTKGYEKKLKIEGMGYKVESKGNAIVLSVGFSHQVNFEIPSDVKCDVDQKGNIITISGIDKQRVGEVAAEIRAVRPPEPYQGKGIRYVDEYVRRKAGKAVVK